MNNKFLIVGGLGDLGFSLTKKIVSCSQEVVITTQKIDESKIQKIENTFGFQKVKLLELDILSEESVDHFITEFTSFGFNFDGLVITIGKPYGNMVQMTTKKDLFDVFDHNLFSIVLFINKFVRIARRSSKNNNKLFSIVIYSSMYSYFNDIGSFAYGSSKSALNYLIKNLSIELKSSGIRINGVAPTVVSNPMGDLMSETSKDKLLKFSNSESPIENDKVSNIVNFLLSEESLGINGQIIKIS